MLSRIAEGLFWTGRYIERAEDIARILDVHLHHMLEDPSVDEHEACSVLLAAMGLNALAETAPTVASITEGLVFDRASRSSIVSSLVAARANARGIGEVISSEMWEALNVTYNALSLQVELSREQGLHGFFRFVRERAAILAGLADSTMSKDDAWRFLVLGRSLERVDMLARLLSTEVGEQSTTLDWVTLLRSCSAHEAFLRNCRGDPGPAPALEFLLRERLFPRSVLCGLLTAEQCLVELDPGRARPGSHDEARRLVAKARTSLEFRPTDELLSGLPDHLASVQASVSEASASLAARYFRQATVIDWHADEMEGRYSLGQDEDGAPCSGRGLLPPVAPTAEGGLR